MRSLALLILLTLPARAATRWIEIYGTTDRHGQIEGRQVELLLDDGKKVTVERGGAALLGGYLANARRASGGRLLVVDGGDMFQGTLVSNLAEGAPVVKV